MYLCIVVEKKNVVFKFSIHSAFIDRILILKIISFARKNYNNGAFFCHSKINIFRCICGNQNLT